MIEKIFYVLVKEILSGIKEMLVHPTGPSRGCRARIEQEALYWAEKASSAANIGLHLLDKLAREELRSKESFLPMIRVL